MATDAPESPPTAGAGPLRSRLGWLARAFAEREVPLRAVALAYYAFFSIFPLLLLSLAALGYLVQAQTPLAVELERAVLDYARQTFSSSGAGDTVSGAFAAIAASAPAVGLAGLAGLLWGVSGSLSAVSSAVGRIFDPAAPPATWGVRLRAAGVVLAVGGVFVAFTLAAQALGVAGRFVPALAALEGPARALVNFLLPVPAFLLLYRMLPTRRPTWGAAAWGALAGGLLFGLVQWGFGAYLRLVSFESAFGPLAGLAVLLLWLQFSALAFLLGALLAAGLAHRPGPA